MTDKIQILLQAKIDDSSIADIQSQINGIQTKSKPVEIKVDTTKGTGNIKNMTSAVEKLEEVTKKNLSLDLQKMSNRYKNLVRPNDVAQIEKMINSLSANDPKLGHNIDLVKVKMKEMSVGAEQSRRSLDLANKSAMSFGEAMKQAAYKFGIWSAITVAYYKFIQEIRDGVKFIIEMDTALTEIGMVTNQTREQTAALAKEYNNLAKEMKVTTSEIISGAVEFYRQGLSQEEVMERLKTTTMYSKVANVDFKESAELLTATVNSMGISIEKAADVFLFLGDATATSGEEIGKGFAKTSGSAAALGVEFEKVASWIATISSRTRESAESIGHSINTMLSRLSRITETGFNEEDDTKLNDVSKALHTVGIELTDQEGNFRNFGTIMDEIYAKWGKLDDQTKAYIANVMAGTRQQSRFYNLMEGYGESIDLYEQSLEAAGTAQSKFNLYLESNQATLDKFRTTIEGLWVSFLDSDSLMSLVKIATSFIEVLDSMVQKLGSIGTVATLIIPIVGIKLAWAFRTAYMEVVKLIAAGTAKEAIAMGGIFQNWALKLIGVQTAAGGAAMSLGALTLVTAGLTAGIGLLVYGIMKWAQKSREAEEAFANALDNSQKLNDEVTSLEQLANKQEELTNIENKSVEQKEELIKVQRELAQLYPELATGIDSEGNKIADNLEMTKQLTEEKRKLLEQELLIIKTTADEKLPVLKQELEAMQKEAEEIQKRLVSGDVYENKYDAYTGMLIGQVDITDKLKDRLLELVEAQKEHMEEIVKLEDGVKSYNQILDENAEKQKWARVEELQNQAAKASSIKELKRIEEELKKLGFTSEDITNILSGNIDIVKNKYKKLDEQQIINLQTIENLDATQKQAMLNMLENSRIATNQLIADTKARITAIQAEMNALIALTGGKAEQINLMSKKTSPEEMLDTISGGFSKTLAAAARNDAIEAQRELAKLEGNLKNIDKALANVKGIDTRKTSGLANGKGSNKSGSKSKSKSTKDKPNFIDPIDAEIRAIKNKNDNLEKSNELLREQLDLAKDIEGIEGLNKQYEINGKLIENNKKLLKSYKDEQTSLHDKANNLRNKNKKYNIDSWFDANGEQTQAFINQYNDAIKRGNKKQADEMLKVFTQMQKYKKAWMDSNKEAKNVVNTTQKLQKETASLLIQQEDMARNKLHEVIEAEKRNAYLDLELRQRQANEQLKAAKQEMEDDVAYYQSKIDSIQAEIDSIQESERARQENLERAKRLEEISKLQNKYYTLQYQNLSTLTEEQAKALGLEKEREQYLERQAKIQELLIKLENVRREKNIQQLTKANDGTWQFEYVADEKEIDNINKQVEDLQKEHNKSLKDLKEQTLTDLKSKQEDYDEWERQNDIRRQIEEKQRRIQRYQDEIADLQDKYAEKERITNEAFAAERENLDRYYTDIDLLTDEKMKELQQTFGENWVKIYGTLTGFFEQIADEYDALVGKLSTPLPSPSYEAGEQGFYEPPSGGSSGGGSRNGSGSSSKTDWSKMYMDARAKNDYKTMEYANRQANIERGKGDVVTSNKDIEYIKKKVKGYSTGIEQGLITKDHLAMLHGDKTNWEGVFTKAQLDKLLKSAVLSTVNLVTPKVPNVALAGVGGGDIKQNVTVKEIVFPNVKDAKEIEGAIKHLSTYADQWANRK